MKLVTSVSADPELFTISMPTPERCAARIQKMIDAGRLDRDDSHPVSQRHRALENHRDRKWYVLHEAFQSHHPPRGRFLRIYQVT